MRRPGHLASTAIYALGAAVAIWWFTSGNVFCGAAFWNHAAVTARLVVAVTGWYLISYGIVSWTRLRGFPRAFLTAATVGLPVGCLPDWLYRGYGGWYGQSTIADVHCAFTEGYGMAWSGLGGWFFFWLALGSTWFSAD